MYQPQELIQGKTKKPSLKINTLQGKIKQQFEKQAKKL